ncbi:MAG: hypothetical protein U9R19_15755, partial [Bacteroidota bacterium]|nr:hypothetical protein [Bacteroidota bacterium]
MAVYINGYQITKALEWPVVNKHSFDQDPGISPDFEKYTSIEEASNMREPTSGVLYHAAKQWYLFSHYDYDEALQKSIEYFENLPYVKSLTLTPEGYWLLESYNGQKRQILIGGPDMEYMNHIWGPNGIGPPSKAEMDEQVRNRAKRYLKRLEKGDLFVIESPGNEVSYAERKAAIILPEFIKIMDGKISDRKKTDELVSIGLIPETNKKHAESIVQNFRKSSKMKKRVENLVQRVEKEHGVQPQIKRNSDSKMRQLKDQKLLEGSTPGLKANVGAYSPDGKAIYAGCAYTFEGGFGMFNNEIQQVIDDVKEQDFNSTANIYKDDTNQDSLTGNLSYATFKSLKYGDICYWASHGGRGTGLYIIKVRSKDDVNLWSGNDSLNVIPVEVTTENWPTGHPWFGYVQPAWATNNWNAVLTLSKAITFLSCCYSHQNGWAAACGGGVTIGYDTISYGNTIMINNREFLQRMSGKKGNGNKRKAFEAYNDMPAHHDKMKIVPANAQITLAPGPYDFLPKDGDYVLNNGTGYFEVDTWCHDNVSADQALTFATTGNVTISNVQWDGSNKVKKVTFDWTGDACWEVTVTVQHDKWQSWGAATPSYHKLDVNRV